MADNQKPAPNRSSRHQAPMNQENAELSQLQSLALEVEGIDCSDCALVIEHRLSRLEGVARVRVNYTNMTVQVRYDARQIHAREIAHRLLQMGYTPVQRGAMRWLVENGALIASLTAGFLLLVGWITGRNPEYPLWWSQGLFILVYVLAGYELGGHVIKALRQFRLDTDFLMLIAALGAAYLGDLFEGGFLLFLFNLGHALEGRILDRARRAVRALGDLAPRQALVRREGTELFLPVENLVIGDVVLVRPGERIPIDGQIIQGTSTINQAPVTGESMPVEKQPGAMVFAGTVNGEGVLDVKVDRLARDSTLARIMKLVEQAQEQQSPSQQLTERFSRVFVPAVMILSVVLLILPLLMGEPFPETMRRVLVFLVATSPCALVLGTPAAILSGVAQAARHGVLVKGGMHLENLGRVQALAFDKTGTLTEGEPQITDIIALPQWSQDDLLMLAAGVEQNSSHPLAKAILRKASLSQLAIPTASQVRNSTGQGIEGLILREDVKVGKPAWFDRLGIEIPENLRVCIEQMVEGQVSVFLISVDGVVAGLFTFEDKIRPEAAGMVNKLKKMGLRHLVILSGDHSQSARRIAAQAGLDEVSMGMLPEDKLQAIEALKRQFHVVGMVGDGINDAPALSSAHVGIAMGGAGTDVALETADVVLMASNLERLPFALGLGRATRAIILQNLVIALGAISILATAALLGTTSIGPVVLIHEGSTLLVVMNALRLLGYSD